MERVELLLNAFPEREVRGINRTEAAVKIGGFCKGLATAFEDAYLAGRLDAHIRVYSDIVAWDKSIDSLDKGVLEEWFVFIDRLCLYQSDADLMQGDQILAVGSSHLYRTIKDKRCLFGYFNQAWSQQRANCLCSAISRSH